MNLTRQGVFMKKVLLMFSVCLGFSGIAQAHFLFEPFVGYEYGTGTTKTLSGTSSDYALTAPVAGLRLGYVFPFRAFITVDGHYGSGKLDPKDPSAGAIKEYNATETTGFVTLGYETMERFRLWASVGVSDTLQLKDPAGVPANDITYSGGVPFKAGLGYHLTQHIAINLEYLMHDYKKEKTTTLDNVSLNQAGIDSIKSSSFLLTLSAPFFL
jgi:opacity protein-like surface antigen